MQCEKNHEWKRSIAALTKQNFCDCCRTRGTFSSWCRKGKAFCEHAFSLQRQQHGKDKQNVEFAPSWKNFCRRTQLHLWFLYAFGTFLDKIWSICCKKTWQHCPKHNVVQLFWQCLNLHNSDLSPPPSDQHRPYKSMQLKQNVTCQ